LEANRYMERVIRAGQYDDDVVIRFNEVVALVRSPQGVVRIVVRVPRLRAGAPSRPRPARQPATRLDRARRDRRRFRLTGRHVSTTAGHGAPASSRDDFGVTSALGAGSGSGADTARSLVIPCPVLVGRSQEVEALAAALDAARSGRGGCVFVVGEAGIGKSRLAAEATRLAEKLRVRVLRGRAVPGSGGAAFRPLTEALAPVAQGVDGDSDLAPWRPALAAIVPTIATAAPVDVTAPLRGEAVLRVLSSVCRPGGGLLVLEDLHWADPETVLVVEHLSDNLSRAPVLGIVTLRSEEQSAARDLLVRVRSRRSAQILTLERLNEAQVSAMVFSCGGVSDAGAVERVVSLADGVPFLVEEMLVSPGVPASFAEGVQARLAGLSEEDRRVLVTAAACGRHFDWRLLRAATGLDDVAVADALDRGVAAQLLAVEGDGFRFRHALTAEAVYQSVIPPRREAIAAAALSALDGAHGELPPELRETAARVAELAGERERAGQLHLDLGDEAFGHGALQTALAALERAASLLPPGRQRDAALERLVDTLAQIGRLDEAATIAQELVERSSAPRAARVHLRVASAAATAARWDLATSHLDAARVLVETSPSMALQAELDLCDGEVALGLGDVAGAERAAASALEGAIRDGNSEVECAALQLLGRRARRSSLEAAETWFRRAMEAADTYGLAVWRLRARHELGTIALLDRAEVDGLLEAQRLAESLGAMATAAILDIEIAAGYASVDDLDAAARHGEAAIRRGGELGLDLVVAWGWQHVAAVAALQRDHKRAEAARTAALEAAPGNRDIEGFVVGGQLLAALSADELDRALELASRMSELLRGSQTAAPAHHRAAWPVLLARAGRPEATSAIEEIEAAGVAVGPGGRAWLRLARAILVGRSDAERAATLAVEADAELVHMPMWRSLARRLAAEAASTDGWRVPDGWLIEAEATLRGLGFGSAAEACRALRGADADDMPGAWRERGITRREAEVLMLVVEGCPNREIAERLYLSVRTVEKHVESLMRKTTTRTRTQLARVAAAGA
jgi:DNA-binding CsgD family transcriptional regulator/tetratricopeptide (TPR) repeat protein